MRLKIRIYWKIPSMGNKVTCGGHAKFEGFIDKMSSEMDNESVAHCRRENTKLYCARWVSIRHMLEDITTLIGPDDVAPCKE